MIIGEYGLPSSVQYKLNDLSMIKDYHDLTDAQRIELGKKLAETIIEDGLVDYQASFAFGEGLEVHRMFDMEAILALSDYLESEGISQDDWVEENDLELFKEDGESGIIYTREALNDYLESEYDDFVECLENSVSYRRVELL